MWHITLGFVEGVHSFRGRSVDRSVCVKERQGKTFQDDIEFSFFPFSRVVAISIGISGERRVGTSVAILRRVNFFGREIMSVLSVRICCCTEDVVGNDQYVITYDCP